VPLSVPLRHDAGADYYWYWYGVLNLNSINQSSLVRFLIPIIGSVNACTSSQHPLSVSSQQQL
jgi:hypothetical protein